LPPDTTSRQQVRTPPTGDPHRVHELFEEDRLATLARRDRRPERDAPAIGDKMKLRDKSLRGIVPRRSRRALLAFIEDAAPPAADTWARMDEPSTSKTLPSIRPS